VVFGCGLALWRRDRAPAVAGRAEAVSRAS